MACGWSKSNCQVGVVFGRSDLGGTNNFSPGIYVLVGEDPDGPSTGSMWDRVKKGSDSLSTGDESKDFNNTVVFVSKDGGFNRASSAP